MKEFCALIEENGKVVFQENEKEQYEWSHKWDKKVIRYCVLEGTRDVGIFSKLRKAVGISFTTWGLYIPIKFKRVRSNQNPDITIQFVNDENQDPYFKEKKSVLAYAYYPKTSHSGVVRFNDYAYNWSADGKPIAAWKVYPANYPKGDKTMLRTYNVIHVLIHELGHSLGLTHAEKKGDDVMDPYYHQQITLSDYDILRIRKKYGIRIFRRWNLFSRLKRAITRRKRNL